MDQKKRRNSILKKPPTTDDENTGEITTKLKRRISFSGKKSVKEFLAGEEQATIWGTSYEESAECLHVNTTESSVVGVNDKRIVLRNRRVVIDTNRSNKRRSKKHVQVAENDKENVFVPTPQVEVEDSSAPVPVETACKGDSPVKTELAVVKSQVQSAKIIKGHLDSLSAFSTTFDFINYSGAVNKSVTIEQSVDVSLDENELQMYKFRVPVSVPDVSPNLSVCRDGSSPNIFSGSIIMSDEDMNMLKLLKVRMGGLISKGEDLKMIEPADTHTNRDGKQTDLVEVNMRDEQVQERLLTQNSKKNTTSQARTEIMGPQCGNETDAVGNSQEAKSLKRKTITTSSKMDEASMYLDATVKSHATVMDIVAMDVHSPLRKKPMHKHMNKTMDMSTVVVDEQPGLARRQTIHFEAADINETVFDEKQPSETSVLRQIHFDQNQIHEDTICQEVQDDPLPMELSFTAAESGGETPKETATETTKKRQSIHGPVDILEDSPKKEANGLDGCKFDTQRKSIYAQITIVTDSPTQNEVPPSRRDSVYTPTDIVEESPKHVKGLQTQKPKDRQTIYNTDIVPETSMFFANVLSDGSNARSTARKTIVAAVDMDFDTQGTCSINQKSSHGAMSKGAAHQNKSAHDTIADATDFTNESSRKHASRGNLFGHQESMKTSGSVGKCLTSTKPSKTKVVVERKSIYTPSDMVEVSPKMPKAIGQAAGTRVNDRKSIYTPADIVEDSPKKQNKDEKPEVSADLTHGGRKTDNKSNRAEETLRMLQAGENMRSLQPVGDVDMGTIGNGYRSMYNSSDMIEGSPKLLKTVEARHPNCKSIYAPSDMVEDSPQVKKTDEVRNPNVNLSLGPLGNARKSIYAPSDMIEDSPKVEKTDVPKTGLDLVREAHGKFRKSIHMPADMDEATPKMQKTFEVRKPNVDLALGVRKSIYTSTDMVEDSPKIKTCTVSGVISSQPVGRKSIYATTDMEEDLTGIVKPTENNQNLKWATQSRKSVFTTLDIVEDSPKLMTSRVDPQSVDVQNTVARRSIYNSADMIEDSPLPASKSTEVATHSDGHAFKCPANTRGSIYKPLDMVEDSFEILGTNSSHMLPVAQRQRMALQSSAPKLVEQNSRQTDFGPTNICEKSLTVGVGQDNSQRNVKNMTKQRALSLQTICDAVDIHEDSPLEPTPVEFISRTSTQQVDCPQSPQKTNCAPTDILEKSPATKGRHSIYTPVDIMEDSPKQPDLQSAASSAPKVIVRHMTLQQGLMGENAAMRVLQKQQTKAKVAEPVPLDASALEMSIVDNVHLKTSPPNFLKLNEQMVRGEVKALAEERQNKKSLFDRLEMIDADVPPFESFHKKSNPAAAYLVQTRKSTVNDYTMEFTSNTFVGRTRKETEYTMDMSKMQRPDDFTNLSLQISPVSGGAPAGNEHPTKAEQSKRQTMHFQEENEMDVSSTVASQGVEKSHPNRKTIHFHEQLELDTTRTQTHSNHVAVAGFEKNPRTIYFQDNNLEEETKPLPTVRADQPVQDVSAMDVSIQDNGPINDATPLHVSGASYQQNLMRQSCIMRATSLDTASQSIVPKRPPNHAPSAELEATRTQTNDIINASMDLSASICPQPLEPKCTQESQVKLASSFGQQRRTIHWNDDLEVDDTGAECPSLADVNCMPQQKSGRLDFVAGFVKPTVRQSACERERPSGIPTRIAGRKTIHFNQDLELDDCKAGQSTKGTERGTKRQTIYTQQTIDMDASLMEQPSAAEPDVDVRCKEDVSKALPKPRRMTTFDEVPIEVDEISEKISMRKSSFSRTLNFGEVTKTTGKFQSIEDNESPLLRPKLKRCESTAEIDRSLAEYLKAEAAATLHGCSPDNKAADVAEQSSQSEYYDAEGEQVERERFINEQQDSHKDVPMLEESGMQPLQSIASRRNIEESAIDERTSNQDEPESEPQDMSFEPRGLLANRLNHEFFDKEVSMSPKPEERDASTRKLYANVRRQTNIQPEAMMEQSGIEVMCAEQPLEPKEVKSQPNRKTIHFTNENAVDESFFDENISKPAAPTKTQTNRHTVYFNESQIPIDAMDTSLTPDKPETQTRTIGRSKAAQSMKEILRESNMLFTQSMLKPHFFETKHSTLYFNAKDISLETVPVGEALKQQDENLQCTPTKTNKSRIPQLIDSARKLQSMKKSMEYIQQKLPNLSCSAPTKEDDEVAKPVDQVTEERSSSCDPEEIHEESIGPAQQQESFETVEIPRRATTFQRNDTMYLCQNEVDLTNISQKSNYRFEDVPITISDVSTYFAQQPPPSAQPPNEGTCSPNTTEALCNLDINKFADESQLPKSCDSDDTTYNFAKFKKRYVELTSDSLTSTGLGEDIEKTHLSLVNTLDEHESEVVHDTCSEQLQAVVPPPLETTKFSSSVCRKCKGDKRAVSQNDTTLGSFHLPPLREYEMKLDVLRELGNKPRLSGVANIWKQNLRGSDSFNLSDGRSAFDVTDDDALDNFKASLETKRRMAARQGQKKEFKQETSFVDSVRQKLQGQKTNWILNDLLLMQNILKFTHTRIRTFAIFISFTPKDARGVEVDFKEIRVLPNDPQSRTWAAFDYVLHYQMLVELPFSLIMHYPKSENLFQLLEHVENVTQEVLKIGKDIMFHILTSPATLIRESTGPIYIRKFARTRTAQNEVRRKEFQIEVMNMKKLSYESITMPPLYEFDEKIQLLPTGPDFLRVFLADPLKYLKT